MQKEQRFRLKSSDSGSSFSVLSFFLLAIGMAAMLWLFTQFMKGGLDTEQKIEFGLLVLMMIAVLRQVFGGKSKEQMMGNVFLKEEHYQHNVHQIKWSQLTLTEYRGENNYLLMYTIADAQHRYWFLSVKDDELLKALQERPLNKRRFANCSRLLLDRDIGAYQIQAPEDDHFLNYSLDSGRHSEGKLEGEEQKDYTPEYFTADPKLS